MKKELKAFTLVELLVSMAIIGVLLGLTLYGIGAAQRNARDAARKASMQDINAGIQDYYTKQGAYPNAYQFVEGDPGAFVMGKADGDLDSCSVSDPRCVSVPLDGPAAPVNTTARISPLSMTDPTAANDGANYCFVSVTDGYALSVQLENGTIFHLGSSVESPGCYEDSEHLGL